MATTLEKTKVAKKVAAALVPPKLGGLIDNLYELREKKRGFESEAKKVEAEIAEAEELITQRMDEEGAAKATGMKATVSFSMSVVGTISDRDVLNAWVKKTGCFQLFENRISAAAYRELLDAGKKVPGVEPFNKRKLNLRVV